MRKQTLGLLMGVSLAALAACSGQSSDEDKASKDGETAEAADAAEEADSLDTAESADADDDGTISKEEAEGPLKKLLATELKPGLWRMKVEEMRDRGEGEDAREEREDVVVCVSSGNMERAVDRFLLLGSSAQLLSFPDGDTEFTELKVTDTRYLIETKGTENGETMTVSLTGEISDEEIEIEAEGEFGEQKRTLSMTAEWSQECEEGDPDYPIPYDRWKNGESDDVITDALPMPAPPPPPPPPPAAPTVQRQ